VSYSFLSTLHQHLTQRTCTLFAVSFLCASFSFPSLSLTAQSVRSVPFSRLIFLSNTPTPAAMSILNEESKKHVDHQDSFGNTALMIAANQGDFLKVKSLLEQKADVNKQDKYGQTALVFAAFSGYQDIVDILLRYKAQPDIQTKFGQTALMKAAFSNSHHIMSLLVQAGANVDLQCADGRTALMIAGQCNNLKIVQYLAEQGKANLNIQNQDGRTAMHLAAEKGCLMVVEYLTKVGADYNIKDKEGKVVYDIADRTSGASAEKMRELVEAAVKRGLDAAAALKAEKEAQEQQEKEKAEAAEEGEEGTKDEELRGTDSAATDSSSAAVTEGVA